MAKEYGNESMRLQEAVEACRMYPNNYLGTRGIEGTEQTIHEILSNSIDEAKSGYGTKINVTINKDGSVIIEDFGRGIPMDWNPKQNMWNWDIAFQKIHGGGKMADNRTNYKKSGGQHGIGAGVTAMTSEWFKCESRRDGYIYNIEFKKGTFTGDKDKVLKKEKDPKGKSQQTGTKISWIPDITPEPNGARAVFTDINYDLERLKKWVKSQAVTCKGVQLSFEDKRNDFKETYKYDEGLAGYVKELLGDKAKNAILNEFTASGKGKDCASDPAYEVDANVVFTFTEGISNMSFYHNNIPLGLGGSPKDALEKSMCDFFTKQLKAKGVLKKEGLEFEDISENLICISHTETELPPAFKGQTKDLLANPFIEQFLIQQIGRKLDEWAKNNPLELNKVVNQVMINQESRLSANSARQLKKEKMSGKIKISDKIEKLIECSSKDPEKTEVFFCLVGDTKIKLLNGKDERIEDLVGKKSIWAYSTNKNGAMIPAKIKEVFKTQDVNTIIKITLSDGSSIECTPEHKFLDRETISWVEAKNLKIGQSLFSMKFKKDALGHQMVYIPGGKENYISYKGSENSQWYKGVWEAVHIRTAQYLGIANKYNGKDLMDIHHKDLNKLNNEPENLQFITKKEHLAIHNKINYDNGIMSYENKHFSEESRQRMQNAVYNRSKEGIEKQKIAVSQAWKDGKFKNATFAHTFNNSEKRFKNGIDITQRNKILKYTKFLIDNDIVVNAENFNSFENRRKYNTKSAVAKYDLALSKYFNNDYTNFIQEAQNYNLEIVNIEVKNYKEPISVYCLNIDNDFHSFVLDNGIITHNCEGDSAANIADARDSEFQALYAMRGKPQNVRKMNVSELLSHPILTEIIKIYGTGITLPGNKHSELGDFDITKRRYGKYIICSDADVDGSHIAALMLTIVYTFMPDIIKEGRLYRLLTPLFVNTLKDGSKLAAFTDLEQNDIIKKYGDKIKKTNRFKGLGEWKADEFEPYMNPATRKLLQYTIKDAEKATEMVELWMGTDADLRKQFISLHGPEYQDLDFAGGED